MLNFQIYIKFIIITHYFINSRRQMIRYSQIARLATQSRYILNHKKVPVNMPQKKPAKYIYEIKYHPVANPGIDMSFPDHQHLNPFQQQAGSRHQNFRYSYAGQWWQGHFVPKILYFFAPAFIFLGIIIQTSSKKRREVDAAKFVMVDSFPYNATNIPRAF